MLLLVLIGLTWSCVCPTAAILRFANYYGSSMVLQKAPQQAQIWGYGTSGTIVHVYLDSEEVSQATVAPGGKWSTHLPAQPEGGPHTVEIRSSEGHLTLRDVWYGDVWVCSGQSNMEFSFSSVYNATAELNRAVTMKNIRFMHVAHKTSSTPLDEPMIEAAWQSPGRDYATNHFSALCLLYAMELSPSLNNRSIGLIESNWGGTPIEAWSSPDALTLCNGQPFGKRQAQYQGSQLWNGMIQPLLPMTIYGAIWYQGEANSGRADAYTCQFKAMIDDWRKQWHVTSGQTSNDFPFGFVQLAAWRNQTVTYGFPDLRWSQTRGYGYVPNPDMQRVFMAVAMDLPDFNSPFGNIHPRDKQDVAIRLALGGRAVAYGESNLDYQGPFPTKYTLTGHSLVIVYDGGKGALDVRSNAGFQVCCAQSAGQTCNNWHDATMTSHDATSVTIDTSACHGQNHVVQAVRYAWQESPCKFKQCPIYDQTSDLPAPPFKKEAPFA